MVSTSTICSGVSIIKGSRHAYLEKNVKKEKLKGWFNMKGNNDGGATVMRNGVVMVVK
jgi:hypothetical protein